MAFDAFKNERAIIDRGDDLIAGDGDKNYQDEFKSLLKDYKRLFKVSRCLVRMSDRNEVQLKDANTQITEQQAELERAHSQLTRHADVLEEKVHRTRQWTKPLVL